MRRASEEREFVFREWRKRSMMDAALEPGRFRKGRTACGCPRRCEHCRAKKLHPKLQTRLAQLALREWMRAL